MTETKFTPGPWRLSRFSVTLIEDEAGRGICTTGGYQQNFDTEKVWLENQANARLIAAAPDLLEALKYLVAHCKGMDRFEGNPINQAVADARAALSKALGKEG